MADGAESTFNPQNPNNFNIEAKFLLIPGFIIICLALFLIYRLLTNYKKKELEKQEKKKKREERKKK